MLKSYVSEIQLSGKNYAIKDNEARELINNLSNIQSKRIDTDANWQKQPDFIPNLGETIIYSDTRKVKIGDGVTTLKQLKCVKGDTSLDEELYAFPNNKYDTYQVRNSKLVSDTKILPTEEGSIVWYYR